MVRAQTVKCIKYDYLAWHTYAAVESSYLFSMTEKPPFQRIFFIRMRHLISDNKSEPLNFLYKLH